MPSLRGCRLSWGRGSGRLAVSAPFNLQISLRPNRNWWDFRDVSCFGDTYFYTALPHSPTIWAAKTSELAQATRSLRLFMKTMNLWPIILCWFDLETFLAWAFLGMGTSWHGFRIP
ncbi:hypothetical protein B0H11DRAFT_1807041 [Mycena galericulata]|nr:hypothetical protein B0H11DRAFT_1807041 [Mycena galericulata]